MQRRIGKNFELQLMIANWIGSNKGDSIIVSCTSETQSYWLNKCNELVSIAELSNKNIKVTLVEKGVICLERT